MSFRTNAAPYQRAKRSTLQIMIELCIALGLLWIVAVIYTFMKAGSQYGIKAIVMMLVSLIVTALCDVLTTVIRHKKKSGNLRKEIVHDLIHNYSYVTAMIFTLTLPVWVSYYVVIIGAIFATVVVKNVFGGFGKNIFNPAIMARIFVGFCFSFALPSSFTTGIDVSTGATVTTAFNGIASWLSDASFAELGLTNLTMSDLFLGNYFGAMGEPFTILILLLGVALSIRQVINWRTPAFYLGTVILTSLVIGLVCGFENPFRYVGYQLALGGLAFGAVFMLTDPVTGPTSPFGKCLIGVLAGFMTVLIRIKGSWAEGVMFSIAICNAITATIDFFTVGKTTSAKPVKYAVTFGGVALSMILCSVIAYRVNFDQYNYSDSELEQVQEVLKNIQLEDGHHFGKNTLKVSNEWIHDNDEYGLEATYGIYNSSNKKVAVIYSITCKGTVFTEDDVDCVLAVAFNLSDGSIYGVNVFKAPVTANWAGESAIIDYGNTSFTGLIGKDAIEGVDGVTGTTFGSKNLRNALIIGYEQFVAEYGN